MKRNDIFNILFLILIIILILLLGRTCNQNKNYSNELDRIKQNQIALNDTILFYKENDSILVSQKKGLLYTLDELKNKEYDNINQYNIKDINDVKYITKTEFIIKEIIKEVPVKLNDSLIYISFDTIYGTNNFFKFNSVTQYFIDSNKLFIKPSILSIEQNVELYSVIKKNKNIIDIEIKTKYPNIKFNKIESIVIEEPQKNNSIKFGLIGGYGIMLNNGVKPGPFIGIGISYTPKIF
jgi:hypothetical protein